MITARVQTLAQAINALVSVVESKNLSQGIENSLDQKLQNSSDARPAFPKVDHQVRLAGRCPALRDAESILRLPGSTAQRNLDAFAA